MIGPESPERREVEAEGFGDDGAGVGAVGVGEERGGMAGGVGEGGMNREIGREYWKAREPSEVTVLSLGCKPGEAVHFTAPLLESTAATVSTGACWELLPTM